MVFRVVPQPSTRHLAQLPFGHVAVQANHQSARFRPTIRDGQNDLCVQEDSPSAGVAPRTSRRKPCSLATSAMIRRTSVSVSGIGVGRGGASCVFVHLSGGFEGIAATNMSLAELT